VLDDLDLNIQEGEFVILLGANGTGKSTLLKIITGELSCDNGDIILCNENIASVPVHKRAKFISSIKQDRYSNLTSKLTISEVLLLSSYINKPYWSYLKPNRYYETTLNMIKGVNADLSGRVFEQIESLSGGEHQVLTLLTVISILQTRCSHKKMLLLDEHVAHLDPQSSCQIMDITTRLIRENKITTLMVTHDIEIAKKYGDRIMILKNGKIVYNEKFISDGNRNFDSVYNCY
jgi:putative ABC transport system ATP-binding protein